jgi:hypothetical protein
MVIARNLLGHQGPALLVLELKRLCTIPVALNFAFTPKFTRSSNNLSAGFSGFRGDVEGIATEYLYRPPIGWFCIYFVPSRESLGLLSDKSVCGVPT